MKRTLDQKRFVCNICLKKWYKKRPLKDPAAVVKTFATFPCLINHVKLWHPRKVDVVLGKESCDSDCKISIADSKPKELKCTALIADGRICHQEWRNNFKCRFHFDRHTEIDHANIQELDKYSLADLCDRHFKKATPIDINYLLMQSFGPNSI